MSETVDAVEQGEMGEVEATHDDYEVTETRDVPVDDVKWIDDVYPRESVDEQAVSRYKNALDKLPPIELSADYTLIDGYHRLRAFKSEGRDTITAEITTLSDSTEVYLAALEANNDHGQQLAKTDKKAAANDLRLNHRMEHDEIASILGVAESTARGWCSSANKELRQIRREKGFEYYLDYLTCPSQQAVADRLAEKHGIDASRQTVTNDLANSDVRDRISSPSTYDEIREMNSDDAPDWLRRGNVWRFNSIDKQFGSDWPGRVPGQIVQNLLIHYTGEYDLVVDPMAGGGMVPDVCKAMGRRYAAYDVNALEDKGVREGDSTDGFSHTVEEESGDGELEETEVALDNGVADLVFMDPPYGRLMDDDYADGGISSASVEDWVSLMGDVIAEAERVSKTGGTIALLIEPFLDEDETAQFQDLTFKCVAEAAELGIEQIQRVSVPMNLADKTQRSVEHAKENNLLVDHNRDLIIWEVE